MNPVKRPAPMSERASRTLRPALLALLVLSAGCGDIVDIEIDEQAWEDLFGPPSQSDPRDERFSAAPVAVVGGHRFVSISVDINKSCGVTTAGEVYCWGDGSYAQIASFTPQRVPLPGQFSMVSVNGGLCALSTDGVPHCGLISQRPVSGAPPFTTITNGHGHACGLTAAGAAYCWGFNRSGQLGDGTTESRTEPVPVSGGHTFTTISAGAEHSCAVTAEGAGFCWGISGGLGHAEASPALSPMPVAGGHRFTQISAGLTQNSCGITITGAAYCWGRAGGAIGDGVGGEQPLPVLVTGGHKFAQISVGFAYACGVTTGGDGFCWGNNYKGKLGDRTNVFERLEPTRVSGGLKFAAIDAGRDHTCGRDRNGFGYCWGFGGWGQLGREMK